MNKHLIDFIDDELKNNDYYEYIRVFAENKEWKYVLSAVVNNYEDHMDVFGPYRFMDAIEDFLREAYETGNTKITWAECLDDVIEIMWKRDYFERY